MIDSLKKYQVKIADWRQLLKSNQRRTLLVISIFILLYIALGLFIDLFIYSEKYPKVPLSPIFYSILTFQLIPYATIITTIIAILSLAVTFIWYDKLMLLGTKYDEVTPETAKTLLEKQLYNTVEEMKVAAGLRFMPRVFILDADYMNAFASGYSEKSAMIAITKGLLEKLNRAEIQAVMAHELSHIRHMDIKLTLMASVLANLMLMMIDILFYSVVFGRNRRSEREGGNWLVLGIIVLRYLLPLITVLLVLFLSRTREYMADAGSVELTRNNEPLANALLKIQGDYDAHQEKYAEAYNKTPHESTRREAYIFDPITAGIGGKKSLSDFFSTHPNIQKRLEAIGFKTKRDE
ncbi:MAG: zinc metalloprotease HtpX [Gammaproteobacteria bacterium]|nr:zinc metalloprotease HtpX [Gammaproteobacteria bacterium]